MQWFSNFVLPENWKLQGIVYLAIAVVAIIALTIAYRALFSHRLRLPSGGRARQSRLGLVDAFSLDGQRQLVLVRRDNVEHLVMIGGLNDVVIESQIIRVHAQASAPAREKENLALHNAAAPKIPTPSQPVAPSPAAPIQPPAPPARPQARPEPPNIAAQTRTAPKPLEPPAAKPVPVPPLPTRTYVPPAPPSPPSPPAIAPSPAPPAPTPPQMAPSATAKTSLPPPIVVASPAVAPLAQPAPKLAASAVVSAAPPKEPPKPAATGTNQAQPFSDLDSLEAEMAKLLGRKN
jgi:hypothetical protein